MTTPEPAVRDVMLVCRNGHVITDLLQSCPDSAAHRCDRCGAATLDRCTTCGRRLPGAVPVPGLRPIGRPRPPAYCAQCGAAFPWARRPSVAAPPLAALETLLRRLPRVIRQLRSRHRDRTPFRVADIHDLEDLLRAVLPLHFDDVRLLSRTPSYAITTRTDLFIAALAAGRTLALTPKWVTAELSESDLSTQWTEDVAYHEAQRDCGVLLGLVYDPEARLPDPPGLELAWARTQSDLELRCVVCS
jgi:rRNA maturation protein Nop10